MKLYIKKKEDGSFETDLSVSELLKILKTSEFYNELTEKYEILYALNEKIENEIYDLKKMIKKLFYFLEFSIISTILITIIQWSMN